MFGRMIVLVTATLAASPAPVSAPWAPRVAVDGGRIEGVAVLATRLAAARVRVRVYDEPGTAPATIKKDANPIGNVVLYLESTPALRAVATPGTQPALSLRQHDEQFVPHVLPLRAGSSVAFPNDDPIFHNVFSLSGIATFDLGRYPAGSSKSWTFGKPGVAQVFCHIHADMSAFVLAFDHPFFVVPDSAGNFHLDGIPPGDYQLMAWHERIKPLATPVHVEAGRTTTIKQLRIPLPEDAK